MKLAKVSPAASLHDWTFQVTSYVHGALNYFSIMSLPKFWYLLSINLNIGLSRFVLSQYL